MAFIHENTAAGLFYGLDRLDKEKHLVIFYNMGSSSLKVSLLEYSAVNNTKRKAKSKGVKKKLMESVNVIAEAWDESVNGQLFTIRLAEIIADAYDGQKSRKGKPSIRETPRSWLRLIQNSEKQKIHLSSNKEIAIYL